MQSQDELLLSVQRYRHNAAVVGRAHFISWEEHSRWNRLFGIPVVILTALVGTAIFSTLQQEPGLHWRILAGGISILAAVLSALQTYLNYSEQAAKHKEAGGGYAEIRRRFDLLAIEMSQKGSNYDEEAIKELKRIVGALDELSKKSPSVSDKIYDTARQQAEAAATPSDLRFKSVAQDGRSP
jgi:hypothetical protein